MVTIESHFRVITRVIHVDLNRIENLDSADLRFFKNTQFRKHHNGISYFEKYYFVGKQVCSIVMKRIFVYDSDCELLYLTLPV